MVRVGVGGRIGRGEGNGGGGEIGVGAGERGTGRGRAGTRARGRAKGTGRGRVRVWPVIAFCSTLCAASSSVCIGRGSWDGACAPIVLGAAHGLGATPGLPTLAGPCEVP